MSIIVDDIDKKLAERLRAEREQRGWSLGGLAQRSGVSKAMLSRVERGEASPTAVILARIAAAFGETLAKFLSFEVDEQKLLARAAEMPVWTDPQTNYVRRQIYISRDNSFELVEITLPKGAEALFPASVYHDLRHVVWVLTGRLIITEGEVENRLETGDRYEFGEPADIRYQNDSEQPCRYLVAVARRR
jgi:transcriptional regulator with XRE-family HTH domain